ncbi:hypothetical protein RW110999_187 [Cyanophage S-RIM4]|nr:hypothetical protein RW110999_187 [Cyanophage S-RIM4]
MPNKHLEHIEDSIFYGRRTALYAIKQALTLTSNISVKYDGAPAVVFGTNPDNGRFFVGTKSVFNKKKVLINYSYEDIAKNHKGNVADILRLVYRYAPRIRGIVQADWIGVGGGNVFSPNTLEYEFAHPITQQIILAPHTFYERVAHDAEGRVGLTIDSSDTCYMVNTMTAYMHKCPFAGIDILAKVVALLPFTKIPNAKVRLEICKHINAFIRAGSLPHIDTLYAALPDKYKKDVNLNTFKVWSLIYQLKMRLLDAIEDNSNVKCFIEGQPTRHEGFVIVSNNPYKIVDRLTFSKANFNLDKNWTNEEV